MNNPPSSSADRPFFELGTVSSASRARTGILHTGHGDIRTPVFMPVGTQGSVKGVSPDDLRGLGAQIILGNTYHLYLRPGTALLARAGGLHRFMAWDGPILTDSGGFQVWSLQTMRKISREGVLFRSHIDGSKHLFTAESVMEAQRRIGADIIMAFDECTPYPATREQVAQSLALTQAWTERAVRWLGENPELHGYPQRLFGIVQGGMYEDARAEAVEHLAELDLPGYAIGGLSVGEPAEMMYAIAAHCTERLPTHKPRYVMGVGTPSNLLTLIGLGVDMFDCVMPTRNARNGMVFTWDGPLHFKAASCAECLDIPLDRNCACQACRGFSRAYLRHLFKAGEMLALRLASIHNLHFYCDLMARAREHILAGDYETWSRELMARWEASARERKIPTA